MTSVPVGFDDASFNSAKKDCPQSDHQPSLKHRLMNIFTHSLLLQEAVKAIVAVFFSAALIFAETGESMLMCEVMQAAGEQTFCCSPYTIFFWRKGRFGNSRAL